MQRLWAQLLRWMYAPERQRCAQIAHKPSAEKRIPPSHDPMAWGSGYLQACDDIEAEIRRAE